MPTLKTSLFLFSDLIHSIVIVVLEPGSRSGGSVLFAHSSHTFHF